MMNESEIKWLVRYKKGLLVILLLGMSGVLILFFPDKLHLLLLLISLVLIYKSVIWIRFYNKLKKWQKTDAIVISISELSVDEVESQHSKRSYYYPVIEYEYVHAGAKFKSNKVTYEFENIWVPEIDGWGSKTAGTEKFWSEWSVGSNIPVYIDPKNPELSVVINSISGKRLSHFLALLFAGIILFILWVFLVRII